MQHPQPFIVRIVEPPPAPHLTLLDVFVGSLSLTIVAVLVAAVLGAVLAFVLVRWRRTHPPEADHLPPVSPSLPLPPRRPSSPAQ